MLFLLNSIWCKKYSVYIWSGIKLAIDTFESFPYNNYQKSIMVFTDGESNCDPPEGILPTLKSTLKTCKKINFTISTFSFGNEINPDLLVDISKEIHNNRTLIPRLL